MSAPHPDAELILACEAARVATKAYMEATERNAPTDVVSELLDREYAAIAVVTVTHAKTTAGLAVKAVALDDFTRANSGSKPPREAVALAVALVEDGLGVVKGMIDVGTAEVSRKATSQRSALES